MKPTQEDLRHLSERYEYCLDTGELTRGGLPVTLGRGARGHLTFTPYLPSRGKCRPTFVHVFAFALLHGGWPDHMVDHVDRDKLNNRPDNLRPACHSTNGANCAPRSGSGYKGVYPERGRWAARIGGGAHRQTKREYLGCHDTPEQAARAYDRRARELYGEYACLNFPIEERCADATNDPIADRVTSPGGPEACYNSVREGQFRTPQPSSEVTCHIPQSPLPTSRSRTPTALAA
jgi:hypothetical protein